MKLLASLAMAIALIFPMSAMSASSDATIVIFRHGEKPETGLGMLSCQGLNRSLALPAKLFAAFGLPDVAMAPNPSIRKNDRGVDYDYNRPLLTIGPTAIAAGIPISGQVAWNDHQELARRLTDKGLSGKTVFVAWEHHLARLAVLDVFSALSQEVPEGFPTAWADDDFDTIYVLRISSAFDGSPPKARFETAKEGLTGQIELVCPNLK